MNAPAVTSAAAKRRFQANIFADLDRKLRQSSWQSGASEAHGLLSGLACRGIRSEQLRAKAWLLQLTEPDDLALLDGLYDWLLRDLHSDGFEFQLLLPGEDAGCARHAESLADWCGGFVQGFLHDGDARIDAFPAAVREALDDIIAISRLDTRAPGDDDSERQLLEIEEYLRVAAQVIFEELNPVENATAATASTVNTTP